HAKLQRALVLGTRVDKTFSPTCRCIHDVAHIAFRLVRPAEVGVRVLNSSGAAVATLRRARPLRGGLLRLVWGGKTGRHVSARDGTYFPEVVFPAMHRVLRLPSP